MKIEVTMRAYSNTAVEANGKTLKFNHERKAYFDTDGDVEIKVIRKHELSRPHWFLYALKYWLVGLLGLFTPHYDRMTDQIACRFFGTAQGDGSIDISILSRRIAENGRAVVIEQQGLSLAEEGNCYTKDEVAKKNKKRYSVFSWLTRFAVIFAVVGIVLLVTIL